MIARVAVVAIAIAVCATACGNGHPEHRAVIVYLNAVNATESKLAKPLAAVAKANQAFAKNQSSPKAQAQLVQAEQTLEKLQRKLAAIEPPPDARHLRALLLELIGREISLTRELRSLGTFVPRYQSALTPLAAASTSLKKELARSAKGAAAAKAVDADKAAALRSYVATIDAVMTRLHTLQPPAVWRPTYESQLSALAQLRTAGTALAAAIEATQAAQVPTLLHRFDTAAVADQSIAAQRAQIAAVQAYNRRVQSLTGLSRSIERERNRLQQATT